MRKLIKKILEFDFAKSQASTLDQWSLAALFFLFVFGVYDLLMDTGSGFYHRLTALIAEQKNPFSLYIQSSQFAAACYLAFGILVVYISAFAVISYYMSINKYGSERFRRIFLAHLLSNVVGMALTMLFLSSVGIIALAVGFQFQDGYDSIQKAYTSLSSFIQNNIPTIAPLPYWLALTLGMILGALPGYFSHWLGHQSRFVWYLNHRCHHTAEIMHPAGVGPFMFLPELFSNIPSAILGAVCTKLFYYEPLLFETFFLSFLGIITEKFNHSSALYDLAYNFKPLRWLSAYYGNGVYHYMHHSAIPGHEVVNVGGGPFLIWDRIFGTYQSPTAQKPPVGLTNNPQIKLSPVAIVISGWQQIGYELKMNKDLLTRFKILFGGIYYKPPITRDFLIVSY
ncbi:MAG: sterol desaturase family protein [Bacteroidetes bacterium]|nr:sterol desaturase family protein [Bacteroidota bacterium]